MLELGITHRLPVNRLFIESVHVGARSVLVYTVAHTPASRCTVFNNLTFFSALALIERLGSVNAIVSPACRALEWCMMLLNHISQVVVILLIC